MTDKTALEILNDHERHGGRLSYKELKTIRQALTAPNPQPVPENMVLVPKEPTDEMIEAGYSEGDGCTYAKSVYKAMIAEAQKKGE